MFAQVKYHLIAQLLVPDANSGKYMIGQLNELGMSKIRHELQLVVINSEAIPIRGMSAEVVHHIEKKVGGIIGDKEICLTKFFLEKDTFEPEENISVHFNMVLTDFITRGSDVTSCKYKAKLQRHVEVLSYARTPNS